jgi:beta-glucosidase
MLRTPPAPSKPTFPEDFLWGAATASYQIEGSAKRNGGGASVWDTFCLRDGAVMNGDTGQVGCDHYNRFKEDVAIMKQLGLKTYRFSLSWPRLFPEGVGRRNEEGFKFYSDLIDELLAAGITPLVTLFHWDYPQALYERGAWLNPESIEWFAEYTKAVIDAYSDRVQNWITMNETVIFLKLGWHQGTMAPGLKLGLGEQGVLTKHALMAHGRSAQVIREFAKTPPKVSYAPVAGNVIPATDDPKDIEAAYALHFGCHEDPYWSISVYYDPVLLGEWPEAVAKRLGEHNPSISQKDLELMHQPLDFIGLNYYSGEYAKMGDNGPEKLKWPVGKPDTAFDWPITPDGLYWTVRQAWERYKTPIFITENGLSSVDWVALDGHVHDAGRIDFLKRYLQWLHKAIDEGIPVLGYTQWSLMDNFEWSSGFRERFGLVHIDYQTLKRTIKDSGLWYADVIKSQGANIWS